MPSKTILTNCYSFTCSIYKFGSNKPLGWYEVSNKFKVNSTANFKYSQFLFLEFISWIEFFVFKKICENENFEKIKTFTVGNDLSSSFINFKDSSLAF